MELPEFKDKQLLRTAFTHRSFLNETREGIESNERLEFLGDSILSFVVSSHIFKRYPTLKEGKLTNLRAALINTYTLSQVAKELSLGESLLLSKGEEASGGRENKTILANTFESLVGALYLDQGLAPTQKFIEKTLLANLDAIVKREGLKDAKSELQEILQEQFKITPTYQILAEEGPDHAKAYTVGVYLKERLLAKGKGASKQTAEKAAAKNALELLKKDYTAS